MRATSFALADGLIQRQIAHHHLAEPAEVGIEAWCRRQCSCTTDAQQSGIVRRVHHYAVAGGLLMARHQFFLMEELVMVSAFLHTDDRTHVLGRHRVTRRAHCHQGVGGYPP